MRSLHLTLVIFCQILLASFILYSNLVSASPLHSVVEDQNQVTNVKPVVEKIHPVHREEPVVAAPVQSESKLDSKNVPISPMIVDYNAHLIPKSMNHEQAAHKQQPESMMLMMKKESIKHEEESMLKPKSSPIEMGKPLAIMEKIGSMKEHEKNHFHEMEKKSAKIEKIEKTKVDSAPFPVDAESIVKSVPVPVPVPVPEQVVMKSAPLVQSASKQIAPASSEKMISSVSQKKEEVEVMSARSSIDEQPVAAAIPVIKEAPVKAHQVVEQQVKHAAAPEQIPFVGQVEKSVIKAENKAAGVESVFEKKVESGAPQSVAASVSLTVQSPEPHVIMVSKSELSPVQPQAVQANLARQACGAPVVNGGLGPLHLLATTLCSYQPDKPVAEENLNLLYNQRAAVRKSLFDFMSLKFTNLEKFSSRLNSGLEIMPPRVGDSLQAASGTGPSHGWPVVGKCTAHDLKLMAEAAWCEVAPAPARSGAGRALDEQVVSDQSAVISKILHVSDPKLDAPSVEKTIANMNLTQQQLADIQVQATSTRLCRRNALRLTKALFNHLAEDQKSQSESWPELYTQLSEDDCARRRMIDILNALSGFRSDSTSIRRDNVEFAFAMDDLRAKVLENEVNVPLTFDKQFIEVEQFLQQSVKLMLSNIDPARAKLTSLRYRSLMPGPLSADDQCIELHQRLLAKNYPTDCNPTQFGQLPDVLRMAASSLELWSIEKELSRQVSRASGQQIEYPAAPSNKRDLNECIANLVAS